MRRAALAAVTVAAALAGCAGPTGAPVDRAPSQPSERFDAVVARVVDGDTVVLDPGGRARLIGVDTPEVHGGVECYGREASAYATRRLTGRRVRIEVGADPRDRYGRLLVYLYADGRLFNDDLVRAGYATTLAIAPNVDRAAQLSAAARRARERELGLWSAC